VGPTPPLSTAIPYLCLDDDRASFEWLYDALSMHSNIVHTAVISNGDCRVHDGKFVGILKKVVGQDAISLQIFDKGWRGHIDIVVESLYQTNVGSLNHGGRELHLSKFYPWVRSI
jgi:hypothetical protein